MELRLRFLVTYCGIVLWALCSARAGAEEAGGLGPGFSRVTVRTTSGTTVTVVMPRREYHFKPAGKTYYLARGGRDADDGTRERPWATFAHAIGQLQPGDLLYVRGGDYAEPFMVTGRAGSADRPIVISAAPGEAVRIYQPEGWQAAHLHLATVVLANTAHVWIHGFMIEGCLGQAGAPPGDTYGQNGISIRVPPGAGRGIRILNSIVSRAQHCGIKDINNAAGLLIEGNVVFDNGVGSLDHGLYLTSSESVVRGNAIFRNTGYGIHLYSDPKRCKVYNNLCFDNGASGIIVAGPENIVAHNVLAFNRRAGLLLYRRGCTNNVLVNNICYRNETEQIGIDNGGGAPRLGTPSANTLDASAVWPATGWEKSMVRAMAGGKMTMRDPKFMDPGKGDWHLEPGSPCRGMAVNVDLTGDAAGVGGVKAWPDAGLFPATQYEMGMEARGEKEGE